MRYLPRHSALAICIATVLPSCQRTSPVPSVPPATTRVEAAAEDVPAATFDGSTGVMLSNGMTERAALAVLAKAGLEPRRVVEASERVDGRPFESYRVPPQGGTDAFEFMVVQGPGGETTVDGLFWYENWAHESKQSKALRRRIYRPVTAITVQEIKDGLRATSPSVAD